MPWNVSSFPFAVLTLLRVWLLQHNVRFFLDILQNRKSDTLEWIIILLIAGEICVSLYEIIHTAMKSGAVQPYSSELDSSLH